MLGQLASNLKENFRREVARRKGEARSEARMVKAARDVDGLREHLKNVPLATPIAGGAVRMLDGKVMVFHTDGSLRHAGGFKPGKAARKALKRVRQAKAKRNR